jgi:hypothetical protein
LALAALAAATSVASVGCVGFGCGAGPVPGNGKGAKVTAAGVVVYDKTQVGDSVSFDIPVKDTADVDETLMSASIAGADADAFEIEAAFPIDMPAGEKVHVKVTFHPNKSGEAAAELTIQTEEMGPSPAIELRGVGLDPSGV